MILIGIIIVTIVILLIINFILSYDNNILKNHITDLYRKNENKKDTLIIEESPIYNAPIPQIDIVKDFDYKNLYDPLQEPINRPSRHTMGPAILYPELNLYRNFDLDNYRWIGILINNDDKETTDNRVLKLFGREKYRNSNRFEYYTIINSGNDRIKVDIIRKIKSQNELYDNDIVKVPALNDAEYKVKVNKNDFILY